MLQDWEKCNIHKKNIGSNRISIRVGWLPKSPKWLPAGSPELLSELSQLKGELKSTSSRINSLDSKIDSFNSSLNSRIDSLGTRIEEISVPDFSLTIRNTVIVGECKVTSKNVLAFDSAHTPAGQMFIGHHGPEKFAKFVELYDYYKLRAFEALFQKNSSSEQNNAIRLTEEQRELCEKVIEGRKLGDRVAQPESRQGRHKGAGSFSPVNISLSSA